MKIGLLTSGGDCPGLNAAMRAFAKYVFMNIPQAEILGFLDGYTGLIENDFERLYEKDFEHLLVLGGTFLGSKRQPYRSIAPSEKSGEKSLKLKKMMQTYRENKLDCLVVLGGAGTHKTAALLAEEGCNVIALPKTIDNDIFGTEVSFGFHTAMEIATECIDRIHTTAASHGRVMLVEAMGNKTGWLTLYAGLAGGAHMILIPEIPYSEEAILNFLNKRKQEGERYTVIAIAEGAMSAAEAKLKRKQMFAARAERGETTATGHLARLIEEETGMETRTQVIGYLQRGGAPDPYDRALCTAMGSYAGMLAEKKKFGVTVAYVCGDVTCNPLSDVAGKIKNVSRAHRMVKAARAVGVSFGE